MLRIQRPAALAALTGLVLSIAAAPGCRRNAAPPLSLAIGATGPVTFPPSDEAWSERRPLAELSSPTTLMPEHALKVTTPSLDEKGHFEEKGKVIRLWFSDAVIDMAESAKAPTLKITPAVKGRTVWTSASEVEFRAESAFDPDQEYTLELAEIAAPSGKKLDAFKATFHALPIVEVAGKTIHYIPKPGRARVIASYPTDGSLVGGEQESTVVYDQAIDVGLATRLVTLSTIDKAGAKKPVPAIIRHPDQSAYDGQKIDARFIVLARPARPLAEDEKLVVEAAGQHKDDETTKNELTIAKRTTLVEFACTGDCDRKEQDDKRARGESGSSLRVRFSNPLGLGYRSGQKAVHVTPAPKNLYVYGWDELSISASFLPSTTYTIRTDALRDQYGGTIPPMTFTFETRSLPASATMSEGAKLLDEGAMRAFPVTTRNVDKAELRLWALPKGDASAYAKALKDARSATAPEGDPIVVAIEPRGRRDESIETLVDLGGRLERGRAYVGRLTIAKEASGARVAEHPAGSEASRPSMATFFATGKDALAAHVHHAGDKAIVQVLRLASGEPVNDARVTLGASSAATDDKGTAVLTAPRPGPGEEPILAVTSGDAQLMLPLGSALATTSKSLFPDLGEGDVSSGAAPDVVGLLVTDRGVYRPGSKMQVKGFVRRLEGSTIRAVAEKKVRLRVLDPMNKEVDNEVLTTSARGAISREVAFEKKGHTGRFHVRLEMDDEQHTVLADEMVRVAEFETPRFKVDIEPRDASAPTKLGAKVVGRYLFGSPMGGAKVSWTIKKSRAAVKGGTLADAGLSFGRERSWWDDEPESRAEALRPVTGEGELGSDGSLPIDAELGAIGDGPTEITVEADVTDASNRHVSGTMRTTRDPRTRHAGLRLSRRFGDAGQPLEVELGAVDKAGNALAGVKIGARLDRLTWSRATVRAESGATVEKWKFVAKTEGRCEVTSAVTAVRCTLPVAHGGDYRVVSSIDGHDEASVSFWAYGSWISGDVAVPSSGKKVPIVLDKAKYKSGEAAKLLVQSPFAKATALLTIEQGGIVRHETRRVEGPSFVYDLPLSSANAPWTHAAVTLLPIGEGTADYRMGAVRIPVAADDARLEVKVASAKKQYEIREEAEISIEVKKNGVPVKNADVTLGVVDEGVLRMTAYHPRDPVEGLRPGRGLDFLVTDSRAAMLRRKERAHVAGGGDSEGEESLDTRKNFVETAAWLPNLVTDGDGRVKTKVKLPDNLTEFRMTAVALDDVGGGGVAESSFVVTRPTLLEPIMPRYALRGDTFEAAAMVHNNTAAPIDAKVTVAGQVRDVTIPARGRTRVAVPMTADQPGTKKMRYSLAIGGVVKDDVVVPFRVDAAGLDEHPMISGVFADKQIVNLAIPGDAIFDEDAYVSIKTGSALYPELGQRLSYLLDYPHGCVEQTTSSTIPLLAARTIMPWTGTTTLSDEELRRRIEAGITRLATMQTPGGGLAYWPGGSEPNVYGTAYATRALLRAKEIGIERPRVLEGVTHFLVEKLADERSADVRMSIAEVLGEAKELPESSADSLYDMRDHLDASGLASLALALSSLPKQHDRVKIVLDRLEASFDESGTPKRGHDERDWHYWGSDDRDRAQATIALVKLRPSSKLAPVLAGRLSRMLERYSTQSTAWSLLALSDFMGSREPNGGVDVSVKVEGKILDTFARLGGDNKEVRLPLSAVAGKKLVMVLTGDKDVPSAYALEARYKRPLDAAGSRVARRAAQGVSIHRAYSDAGGKPIDLAQVKVGEIVRVALRISMPKLDAWRTGYLAVTDRLPAGFEPVNTDLATSGTIPSLDKAHPYFQGLSRYAATPTHMDLRDDRVQLYFDRVYVTEGNAVYASYLARATTQGTFTLAPASGELMYEQNSEGYSDAGKVTIR
ncbi:MAG: hypothetical protein JST00_18540 [Deltaproteobacteria bacterium]|nr:hypothetical protein [Deltaproteobacteria bacterium]